MLSFLSITSKIGPNSAGIILYFTVLPALLRFKVMVNVFWMKTSNFRFFHIQLAELSSYVMIPNLKLTETLKMEKIPWKRISRCIDKNKSKESPWKDQFFRVSKLYV